MKKVLILLLVLLVVVTGLPIMVTAMDMSGMVECEKCGPAVVLATCTLAVLAAGMALALVLLTQRIGLGRSSIRAFLHTFLLERPPRLA